ncbi:hypothetical protein ACIBCA_36240 [Kitasatospora sp. NPDC051170]|uniref:hypothetical protein n=1 Tax=Kitasatospora sp. NPDC051170 TaxID=3364056 RepID=UPI003790BE5E
MSATAGHTPLAPATTPARWVLTVRLAQAGAGLWGAAGIAAFLLRPRFTDHLPPRDEWGSQETAVHSFGVIANGVVMTLIAAFALGGTGAWVLATLLLRRAPQHARGLVVGIALITALAAVKGVDMLLGSLVDGRAFALLLPLLAVSTAALLATLRLPVRS